MILIWWLIQWAQTGLNSGHSLPDSILSIGVNDCCTDLIRNTPFFSTSSYCHSSSSSLLNCAPIHPMRSRSPEAFSSPLKGDKSVSQTDFYQLKSERDQLVKVIGKMWFRNFNLSLSFNLFTVYVCLQLRKIVKNYRGVVMA